MKTIDFSYTACPEDDTCIIPCIAALDGIGMTGDEAENALEPVLSIPEWETLRTYLCPKCRIIVNDVWVHSIEKLEEEYRKGNWRKRYPEILAGRNGIISNC